MDHYQTLGVPKNATPDEIKKAYRKLASQHHPDRGGDTAEFQKIQQAYDVLSDPNKRNDYDSPQPQGFHFTSNGFPPDFQDIFATMFGQNVRRPSEPLYRTTVGVNLLTAYRGGTHTLQLITNNSKNIYQIQIPKGVDNGMQIRYNNLIPNATLIVDFRVEPNLKFERRVNDLYTNQSISILDLIAGGDFEFETISGKTLKVEIKPKTQPYQTLKIAFEGMPIPNSEHYGDQYILIKPYIPDNIDMRIIDTIAQYKSK